MAEKRDTMMSKGHAGPIVLENAVRELFDYGKQVEARRRAVKEIEGLAIAEPNPPAVYQ